MGNSSVGRAALATEAAIDAKRAAAAEATRQQEFFPEPPRAPQSAVAMVPMNNEIAYFPMTPHGLAVCCVKRTRKPDPRLDQKHAGDDDDVDDDKKAAASAQLERQSVPVGEAGQTSLERTRALVSMLSKTRYTAEVSMIEFEFSSWQDAFPVIGKLNRVQEKQPVKTTVPLWDLSAELDTLQPGQVTHCRFWFPPRPPARFIASWTPFTYVFHHVRPDDPRDIVTLQLRDDGAAEPNPVFARVSLMSPEFQAYGVDLTTAYPAYVNGRGAAMYNVKFLTCLAGTLLKKIAAAASEEHQEFFVMVAGFTHTEYNVSCTAMLCHNEDGLPEVPAMALDQLEVESFGSDQELKEMAKEHVGNFVRMVKRMRKRLAGNENLDEHDRFLNSRVIFRVTVTSNAGPGA